MREQVLTGYYSEREARREVPTAFLKTKKIAFSKGDEQVWKLDSALEAALEAAFQA